jgi:hypothetical protein
MLKINGEAENILLWFGVQYIWLQRSTVFDNMHLVSKYLVVSKNNFAELDRFRKTTLALALEKNILCKS